MKKDELTAQYLLDVLLLVIFMSLMLLRTERYQERRKTWCPSFFCFPVLLLRYILPHHDWVEDHHHHQEELWKQYHHHNHHHHGSHETSDIFGPAKKEDRDIFEE